MFDITLKKDKTIFISLMIMLILLLVSSIFFLSFFIRDKGIEILILITRFLISISIIICLLLFFILIQLFLIFNNKKPWFNSLNFILSTLKTIYPLLMVLSDILKLDKDPIRRAFSQVNNKIVLLNGIDINKKDVLIIAPHCLQDSECKVKISGDIENCRRCGKCNINDLISIRDKYNVKIKIATGGTLARKLISEIKPKGVIAIACERDLSSGLLDVKSIPVIGITNMRPEGPCHNTRVDIEELEKTLQLFK